MTVHRARLAPPSLALLAAALLASCGSKGASADATYTITLRYCSDADFEHCSAANQAGTDEIPESQRALIRAAADRMQQLITAGLVPARTVSSQGPLTCFRDEAKLSGVRMDETVHGLLVLVLAEDLGATGTLASSGPCIVRASSGLPLVAVMKLNNHAGVQNKDSLEGDGRLETVAFHELFHTLGFGTIWTGPDTSFDLVGGVDSSDPRFLGRQALARAISDNGAPGTGTDAWTSIPLEGGGLEGTSSSHWRQMTFSGAAYYELMTGYVAPPNTPELLSAMTLGSLADLGYPVKYAAADSYTIPYPGNALRAQLSVDATPVGDDVLRIPVVAADGEPTP